MDQKLWMSIPANRRKAFPGKHDIYIFGQSSADGTACIGCSWQTHDTLFGDEAKAVHNKQMMLDLTDDDWVK